MNKQPSNQIDTNVDNYTIADLYVILNLGNQPTADEIKTKCQHFIQQFDKEGNTILSTFFSDIETRLLTYLSDPNSDVAALQSQNWYQNEYLTQNDTVQTEKITERKQKIKTFGDDHLPMNREQLGVSNQYSVPVAQDVLNPKLENVYLRFINIDSQFRQASNGTESGATDFTLDLSDPLNNVLSLKLYSVQIPYAWYTFDATAANNCYWIILSSGFVIPMGIPSGNYSSTTLASTMNTDRAVGFGQPGFRGITVENPPVIYNSSTGKLTFLFHDVHYLDEATGTLYPVDDTAQLVFFDLTGSLSCSSSSCHVVNTINQTMGWTLGFRLPFYNIDIIQGNTGDALVDLYGPKYLILCLDDYNQNHINNGLITITEMSKYVKLPTYYLPTLPVVCTTPTNEVEQFVRSVPTVSTSNTAWIDKINVAYKPVAQVVPTAPRILTQSQIYSINEIQKNNERNTNYKSRAPTQSDTFALIPVKHNSNNTTGEVYVEFGGSLQESKRIYFGPVNIDRLRVKLYNDKGVLVNMNGADWSFTMLAEVLYQY